MYTKGLGMQETMYTYKYRSNLPFIMENLKYKMLLIVAHKFLEKSGITIQVPHVYSI
jgi:hypothetical protein